LSLEPEAAGAGAEGDEVVLVDEAPEEVEEVDDGAVEDPEDEDPLSPPSLVDGESFFFDP